MPNRGEVEVGLSVCAGFVKMFCWQILSVSYTQYLETDKDLLVNQRLIASIPDYCTRTLLWLQICILVVSACSQHTVHVF